MIYNRTEAAKSLLVEIDAWCARTATPRNTVGHVLFLHPGFVGLLRKRLTVTEEKEAVVRNFMAEHAEGWRGVLPQTHTGPRRVGRPRLYDLVQPDMVATQAVDRDPCQRCGVRHDIGCRHSRAPVGMMF